MRIRLARPNDDDGAILIIVMLFVLVIGLISGAVITEVREDIATTPLVHTKQVKVYAADAGVNVGIAALRTDTTICPQPGSLTRFMTLPMPDPHRAGTTIPVDISCQTLSGSSNGALGYAVVTTDTSTSASLTTQGGTSTPKTIVGPVYAASIDRSSGNATIAVRDGNVYEHQSATTCPPAPGSSTLTVTPSPPYSHHCVTTSWPDPSPALPTSVPAAAPAPTQAGQCTTFYPGKYTGSAYPTGLPFTNDNYFISGVYYFENVAIDVKGNRVVGGTPSTDEPSVNGDTPCDSDSGRNSPTSSTGVKWILGGTTTVTVENASNSDLELYSRQGGAAAEGDQQVSLMTVGTSAGGSWVPISSGTGIDVLNVQSGSNAELAIHGLVYSPSRAVDLNATNGSQAQLLGGVVASRLGLQASASASGLEVSVLGGSGRRQMVVKATAHDPTGGKDVTAEAVIDIDNTTARHVTVDSWRSTN